MGLFANVKRVRFLLAAGLFLILAGVAGRSLLFSRHPGVGASLSEAGGALPSSPAGVAAPLMRPGANDAVAAFRSAETNAAALPSGAAGHSPRVVIKGRGPTDGPFGPARLGGPGVVEDFREQAMTNGAQLVREYLVRQASPVRYVHVEEQCARAADGSLRVLASHAYLADRLVARLKTGQTPEGFAREIKKRGDTLLSVLMVLDDGGALVSVGLPEVSLDSVREGIARMAASRTCVSADADTLFHVERVPNDAYFVAPASLWGMQKISAPAAWDVRTDATNVIVAILDTGIQYTHGDLAANMWVNAGEIAGNGKDDDGNGYIDDVYGYDFCNGDGDPMDDFWHGTHCAGIVGAVGNNGVGVVGVAWRTRLMAVKFLDSSGNGALSAAISGMNYARLNGASIINCSFGGTGTDSSFGAAIGTLRNVGMIVVAAAGNGGADGVGDNNETTHFYPSDYVYDNIVSVAATGSSDTLGSFSNYGSTSVDIAAPGVGIISTHIDTSQPFQSKNGTSMAAPHVAGALALLKAHYPNEHYLSLINRLYAGGDTVSGLAGKIASGRRLNLAGAIGTVTVPTLGGALNAEALTWTTGGASNWVGQAATTHDGVAAVRSGALSSYSQQSWLRTTVYGAGGLTFWWKTSTDSPIGQVRFNVDGVEKTSLYGATEWVQQKYTLTSGVHTLTWTFTKTQNSFSTMDCGWVDQVAWTPATTTNAPVAVPYFWLDTYGLAANGDYEAAALADADDDGFPAWSEYVAGTVPTNAASVFIAGIALSNSLPLITWAPDLGTARTYTVIGKSTLTNAVWLSPTNAASRFFKVRVEL